jgi:4-hydroxy-tetrahydrodipicolinate synthase
VAGTGSNSTAESIALTKEAEASGADAALLITPYYNKPQQQGLFDHYRAIAESTKLPLVVYNCPGRTGVSISPETLARLDAIANVAAVKDATGDPDWTTEVALSTKLTIVSGDDARTLALMAIGATGVISVSANIAPRMVADQCRAASEGRWDEARRLHLELYRLTKLLFVESNPAPIKAAVEMMGKIGPEIRPPLSTLSALNRDRLRAEMARMKLIAA